MIILGVVLICLGFILGVPPLYYIGILLFLLGLVAWLVPIGGRTRRWY